MAEVLFRGEAFELLPSGALHWPRLSALLVADLHLGKFAAFARSGRMLPPYDTPLTLSRLEADLDRTGAARVFSLGDAFHRDDGSALLDGGDAARLHALCARAEWTWVSGNHDPSDQGLAGSFAAEAEVGGLRLVHDVTGNPAGSVGGHLHPGATVSMSGRSARARCLVHDGERMVVPAYGASTGRLDLHHPAVAAAVDLERAEVFMLGRGRVYPVPVARTVR